VRGESAVVQLQPTEVLNEAAIRILKLRDIAWNDRAHFFATAARMMRQILIDQVRKMRSAKRAQQPMTLTQCWFDSPQQSFDLEALDDALKRLEVISEQKARIVELRFYGGLTMAEIAEVLSLPQRTVERHWQAARAWLLSALLDNDQ
jgi:RNA polymerase sigma factor (TIGR02999 family)